MRTRLVPYAPFGAKLAPLPDALESQIVTPFGEVPTASVHYHRSGVNAAALDGVVELGFEYLSASGWVEPPNCRFISMKGSFDHLEETPTRKYDYVGIGWLLRKAKVWAANGLPVDADGKVQFLSATAGTILATLIANAQGRGWGSGLSVDFTGAKDSSGAVWSKIVTIAYDLELDLETVLSNLYQQGVCDYRFEGRTLRIFNPDSFMGRELSTGSNPVHLVVADGQTAAPEDWTNEDLLSHAMVIGEDGKRWEFSNTNPTALGRLESVIAQGGVSDQGTASLLAQPSLLAGSVTRVSYTREFLITEATQVWPFRDYTLGDWVLGQRGTGFERLRTQSLSLTVNADGVKGHAVLGDRLEDLLTKLAKRTKGITGGASAGGSGVRPAPEGPDKRHPTAPSGLTAAANTYIDDAGVAQGVVSLAWAHDGRATDGTVMSVNIFDVYYKENETAGVWRSLKSTQAKGFTYSPLPIFKFDGVTIQEYAFMARAIASNGLASSFSSISAVRMEDDSTPPPVPYFPAAGVSTWLRMVTVRWDGSGTTTGTDKITMPRDFAYVNVYQATSASMAGAVLVGQIRDVSLWQSGTLAAGVTVFYALASVDRSGNESAKSAVQSVMPVANVDADAILGKIDAAKTVLTNVGSSSITDGAILAGKLADNAVTQAKIATGAVDLTRLDQAANDKITKGITDAAAADSKATAANTAAGNAQSAATTAKAAADQAAADAAAAAGIANSKGKVLVQSAQPLAADRNASTLWIDTSSGTNTPKRWVSGTTWQAVTDKVATDAAAAAVAAKAAADAAQSRADQAFTEATKALTAAGNAQASANGKNNVYYLPTLPSGTGFVDGDTVFIRAAEGQPYTAQYRWDGAAWKPQQAGHQSIASVDLGKATVGELDGVYVKAQTLTADKLIVSRGANLFTDPLVKDAAGWASSIFSPTGGRTGGGSIVVPMSAVQSGRYYAQAANLSSRRTRLIPGGTYRVSTWVKTSTDAPARSLQIYLRYQAEDSTDGAIAQNIVAAWNASTTLADTWTFISGMVKIPEDTTWTTGCLGVFKQSVYTTGTATFSDMSIQQAAAGELIVDGSITAAKVDAVSVAAAVGSFVKVDVSQLNASTASVGTAVIDKLWADVVNSRKITADMVIIGSGANLIPNGAAEKGDASGWPAGMTYDTTDKPAGYPASFRSTPGAGTVNGGVLFDVQPSTEYLFEIWVKADKPGSRMSVPLTDAAGALATSNTAVPGTNSMAFGALPFTGEVPTVWTKYTAATTTGAGVSKLKLAGFAFNLDSGTEKTATIRIAGVTLRPRADASLIVNGGILTRHLTVTEDMTVKLLAAHKILAAEIDTNSLTADVAFVGSMRTNILTANSINGAMIRGDAIDGKTITGVTITGGTLQTSAQGKRIVITDRQGGGSDIRFHHPTSDDFGKIQYITAQEAGGSAGIDQLLFLSPDGSSRLWAGKRGAISMSGTDPQIIAAGGPNLRLDSAGAYIYGKTGITGTPSSQTVLQIDSTVNTGVEMSFNRYGVATGYVGVNPTTNQSFGLLSVGRSIYLGSLNAPAGAGGVVAPPVWIITSGAAPNVAVGPDGLLQRSVSASKYKILPEDMTLAPGILDVQVKNWVDRSAAERYAGFVSDLAATEGPLPLGGTRAELAGVDESSLDAISLRRIPGVMAEDVRDAGGDDFVVYGADGEIEGLMYDRLAVAQIQLLKERIEKLESVIKA